jgi:hypothetical protein
MENAIARDGHREPRDRDVALHLLVAGTVDDTPIAAFSPPGGEAAVHAARSRLRAG